MGAAETCIFIGAAMASLHSSIRAIAMGGLAFLLCSVIFAFANDSTYAFSYKASFPDNSPLSSMHYSNAHSSSSSDKDALAHSRIIIVFG